MRANSSPCTTRFLSSTIPQNNIELNKQIIKSGRDYRAILSLFTSSPSSFNCVNLSTALSGLARLNPSIQRSMKSEESYEALIKSLSARMTAERDLRRFGGARTISNIMHSLAKLNPPLQEIENIARVVDANSKWIVKSKESQAIANTAWAFATLNIPAPFLFKEIEANPSSLMDTASPQSISMTAWAFATLNVPAPALFKRIDACAPFLVFDGTPQTISNTVWAFATLDTPAPRLIEEIDRDPYDLLIGATPQAIANTAWACAVLNIPAPSLFSSIELESSFLVNSGAPHHVASTAWAFAKLNVPAPGLFKSIELEASSLVQNGTPRAISNIAWAFATLNIPSLSLFKKIDEHSDFLVEQMQSQAIANTASAFAKLNIPAPALFQKIGEHSAVLVKYGRPQEIAAIAWAFTALGVPTPILIEEFLAVAKDAGSSPGTASSVDGGVHGGDNSDSWRGFLALYSRDHEKFSAVNWSSVLSKLGRISPKDQAAMKLGHAYPALLHDLTVRMTSPAELRDFGGAREVANIIHSLAKLDAPVDLVVKIVGAMEANSEWLVLNGKPQEIANISWALAKLDASAPALFEKIEVRFRAVVVNGTTSQRTSQHIANTAWAFAKLKVQAPFLFESIDEHSAALLENGKPQHVANTAWAFAKLNAPAPTLLKNINGRPSAVVEHGSPQAIANTAWAFGKLLYDAPEFFSAVDSRSEYIISEGSMQNISNTALAFAELNVQPSVFFGCLEKHAERFINNANNQDLTVLCWSLAILNLVRQHEALAQLIWERVTTTDEASFVRDGMLQLVQFEVHAKSSGVVLASPVPRALRQRMVEAAANYSISSQSRFQDNTSDLLKEIGFDHEQEVSPIADVEGELMAIDIACKKGMIAIECDGPQHYLSSGRDSGRTVAKRRLLESSGWKLINVSYRDEVLMESPEFLNKCTKLGVETSAELKKLYLRKKLESVGCFLKSKKKRKGSRW
jgi:hypothetical protein